MPRKLLSYSIQSHPPFTEDVEELLARFQQTDSVRFNVFSAIWREMGFDDVFFGLPCTSEMRRFCTLALSTAVKYFLPPFSYQIRVGGLYLMYGLYYTQLATPPVHIRLALKDWCHVERFKQDSANAGHYDVLYIYQKLVSQKAVHYSAMPRPLSYRMHRKPTGEEALCAEFVGKSPVISDLLSANIFEEMTNVQNLYEKMKMVTPEIRSKVSVAHRDIVTTLKEHMSDFIDWQNQALWNKKPEETEEVVKTEEDPRCRAELLSSIKQKSYSEVPGASKARRHRPVEVINDVDSKAGMSSKKTSGRKRPVSLFRRTQNRLGVIQDKKLLNTWLLTSPGSFSSHQCTS